MAELMTSQERCRNGRQGIVALTVLGRLVMDAICGTTAYLEVPHDLEHLG